MMQQTIGTKAAGGQTCRANPWPFPAGVAGRPGCRAGRRRRPTRSSSSATPDVWTAPAAGRVSPVRRPGVAARRRCGNLSARSRRCAQRPHEVRARRKERELVSLPPLVEPAESLTIDEVRRYSRHLIIPDVAMVGQKRLKNAKVLCVGAGGLGSPALMYLAAAGRGHPGHRRVRRGRRVQPAAPDHPRPVRHRPAQGRVGARQRARDQPAGRTWWCTTPGWTTTTCWRSSPSTT